MSGLRFLLMAVLVVGLLTTGCSRVQAGQAQPVGTAARSNSPGGTAPQLAPLVTKPKDARNVAPCAVLSTQQVVQLGLDPTTQKQAGQGFQDCTWDSVPGHNDALPSFYISITLDANRPERRGLNDVYLKNTSVYAVFQPMAPVDGYPTARADLSDNNECTLFVGIADTQEFVVDTRAYGSKPSVEQSCALSRSIAAAVLSNLPPLQ